MEKIGKKDVILYIIEIMNVISVSCLMRTLKCMEFLSSRPIFNFFGDGFCFSVQAQGHRIRSILYYIYLNTTQGKSGYLFLGEKLLWDKKAFSEFIRNILV